jgi:hypothetical protein
MAVQMTCDEALQQLKGLAQSNDMEAAHIAADKILLALINDPEITEAYMALESTDEAFYE